MPAPFQQSASVLDLSPRLFKSSTVAASPAAATETTIASVTIGNDLAVSSGVYLFGFAAFTVGASGVSFNLKLRRTDTSGSTVKASGLLTVTAADLVGPTIIGFDSFQAAPGQVYVMTLTVTSGAAESTVSAVQLLALAV